MNQVNQVNYVKQVNQVKQRNQVKQVHQVKQVNQVNQVNQVKQILALVFVFQNMAFELLMFLTKGSILVVVAIIINIISDDTSHSMSHFEEGEGIHVPRCAIDVAGYQFCKQALLCHISLLSG